MATLKEYALLTKSIFIEENQLVITDEKTDSKVAVKYIDNQVLVVYPGTDISSVGDILTDLACVLIRPTWCPTIKIHGGYASKLESIREKLDLLLLHSTNITMIGFSQGACIAMINSLRYKLMHPTTHISCYAFFPSKAGNSNFARLFDSRVDVSHRSYFADDPVYMLPFSFLSYRHTTNVIWVKRNGKNVSHDRPFRRDIFIFLKCILLFFNIQPNHNPFDDHSIELLAPLLKG